MPKSETRPLLFFVAVTYAVTWTVWLAGVKSHPDLSGLGDERFRGYLLAGSFVPSLVALVTAGVFGGRPAIGALLRQLVHFKVDWRVYALTFFLMPAIGLAAYLGLGIAHKIELWKIAVTALPLMPVNALLGGVIFGVGPLGEEMGWRGLLQDRLQERWHAGIVAVVVGIVWAIWHFPAAVAFEDFRQGLSLPQFLVLYPVSTILLAVTMAHFWRWSRGSLPIVILLHAVVNTTASYLTGTNWWDFGRRTPLHIYLAVLAVFALTAGAAELLSRTVLRPPARE